MAIVNGYMDEAERAEFLEYEKADLAFNRALLAYETYMDMHELRLRDVELKCMEESGSYDDLQAYYEAEEKENEEKSKGLVGGVWEAICNLFRSIKKFLFGDKKESLENAANKNPDKEINVDKSVTGCWDLIKSKLPVFKKAAKGDTGAMAETGSWWAANAGKLTGFLVATGATTAITLKFAWEIYSTLSTFSSDIESFTEKKKDEKKEEGKDEGLLLKALQGISKAIRYVAKTILKAVPSEELDKKNSEIDSDTSDREGKDSDYKKQLESINKEIEEAKKNKDDDKVKELEAKKAKIEKKMNKNQRRIKSNNDKKGDIDEAKGNRRVKVINKAIARVDKQLKKLDKMIQKESDAAKKGKMKVGVMLLEEYKKELQKAIKGSQTAQEITDKFLNDHEDKLKEYDDPDNVRAEYKKTVSDAEKDVDNEDNGNDDNDDNDDNIIDGEAKEVDDDKETKEYVEDLLGISIPDSFMMEGSVEDDRKEILSLFDALLNS